MRSFINHVSDTDRMLHQAAKKTLKVIQSQATDAKALPILSGLIGRNAVYNFDHVTKTKTIDGILNTIDSVDVAAFLIDGIQAPSL
jgi:DNA polymerase phi